METLTRNTTAKKLGVTSNHLLYWEEKGELKPQKLKVGDSALVIYTPELMQKAKKLLFSTKGRHKAKK